MMVQGGTCVAAAAAAEQELSREQQDIRQNMNLSTLFLKHEHVGMFIVHRWNFHCMEEKTVLTAVCSTPQLAMTVILVRRTKN